MKTTGKLRNPFKKLWDELKEANTEVSIISTLTSENIFPLLPGLWAIMERSAIATETLNASHRNTNECIHCHISQKASLTSIIHRSYPLLSLSNSRCLSAEEFTSKAGCSVHAAD